MEQKKPDYSKLPNSWGVKGEGKERSALFREKLEPLLKQNFVYDGVISYYGINKKGFVDFGYEELFDKVYTIEEFIELTEGFVLPEEWYVVVTEENQKVLSNWRGCNVAIGCITGMLKMEGYSEPTKEWNDKVNDGWKNEISFEQFKKYILKEKLSALPEKWVVKITEKNRKTTCLYNSGEVSLTAIGYMTNYKKGDFKYGYYQDKIPEGFTEISFKDFNDHIVNKTTKQPTMSTGTVNMQETVKVPQEFFDGLIQDGSGSQRELVKANVDFFDRTTTKQFIKDFYDKEVQPSCRWKKRLEETFPFVKQNLIDLTTGKLDGKKAFGDVDDSLMSVRRGGLYERKGYALNKDYGWEIKEDGYGWNVLIPTKKK